MPLNAGTRLGRYEVRTQIGAGGMGEVYLAQDLNLRRSVALKLLPAEYTQDEGRLRRFEQEACAASGLNHPNILTIHEIGAEGEAHFIATEFIDGESLRQRMTRSDMKLREMLDVVIQVAAALTAAHEAGIVHRDIKPENIMVRRDGYVKVLDFGLAKLIERRTTDSEASTMVNTDPGVVMGTASYMSPEQARGTDVDARTDIWSLGVVIYEMMAGRVPFEGTTTGDMIGLILGDKNAPPLARFAREVPAELERIVTKALTKERDARYQTAKDLLIDLKRLKQQLDVDAEIERTAAPGFTAGATGTSGMGAAVQTAQPSPVSATNAQYGHKSGLLIPGVILLGLAAIAAIAYFGYFAGDRTGALNSSGGKEAITSIAVLPFVNASNNPDAEYLSDGISESLINSLSQLPQLKVIARSSSFKFKGKSAEPSEVAKALGVRAIVSGRVIQLGDQLQISAELVDASDGTQVWGDQYNRKATDLLAMQSEISREIADRLRLKLTSTEQQQLAKRSTTNPEAYELLLKGRFYRNKGGPEGRTKAIEYFSKAAALDPNYALAYAALAGAYNSLIASATVDPKVITPKAQAAVERALQLDETLAEAHLPSATLRFNNWEWAVAEREYKRSIELNPSYSGAHNVYSNYLASMGQHEQAIAEARRARELDPLSTGVNWRVGTALFKARRYDEAIEQLKKALELDPNFTLTHLWLGYTYAAKGQYAEAIDRYREAMRLGEDNTSTKNYLGYSLAMSGKRNEALAILKELQTTKEYVSPAELAVLYAGLGDKEQAFVALERAYDAHDFQLEYLKTEPAYDSLRSDPRFADLLRRVGLPQ
jgi:eukaryotic-like serine/threonine-protein kinase